MEYQPTRTDFKDQTALAIFKVFLDISNNPTHPNFALAEAIVKRVQGMNYQECKAMLDSFEITPWEPRET
jgi:hypothetical protein